MKKLFYKCAITLSALGVMSTSVSSVFADGVESNKDKLYITEAGDNKKYDSQNLSEQQETNEPVYYQDRNFLTYFAKKAVKYALTHKSTVVKLARKFAGKKEAAVVDKYFSAIAKELNPLLKYSNIPRNAVRDGVIRALKGKVSSGTAHSVAVVVAEICDFLF